MPLVIMTGIPCSGKTTRALEIKAYFENKGRKVHTVSENVILKTSETEKNALYAESAKEKQMRSLLKSEAQRLLQEDNVVIIDAGNYIKGYRYELYCMSKASKSTQCTIHCETPIDTAWQWNSSREDDEKYSKDMFDALVQRYEAPDSRNRWDSPLFTLLPDTAIDGDAVYNVLFERAAPPPNQSTQNPPLSSTNFLYELDRITQDIVSAILSAQKLGIEGEVRIPGYKDCVLEAGKSTVTPSELARNRRQFLAYTKLHPTNDILKIPSLFIQYLNTSLK